MALSFSYIFLPKGFRELIAKRQPAKEVCVVWLQVHKNDKNYFCFPKKQISRTLWAPSLRSSTHISSLSYFGHSPLGPHFWDSMSMWSLGINDSISHGSQLTDAFLWSKSEQCGNRFSVLFVLLPSYWTTQEASVRIYKTIV